MLTTYQAPYRSSLLASLMLVLTLLQGTSFTLTLAVLSEFASGALSSLVTLLWLLMYATAALALVASYGLNWVTWLVRYRLPLILLIFGTAFSIAWSVDTGLSAERAIHLIGSTLVALYLGFSLPLTRILRISALVLGLLMVLSTVSVFTSPAMALVDYEGQQAWAGIMASKNTLGFWAAVSTLLLVSLSFWIIPLYMRVIYLVLAAFSALCLYNSVSATSALSLISASLVMLYLYTAFNLRLGMIAMTVLAALVAGLLTMGFYVIDTAELIGRTGDLTGRGDVWSQTWQLVLERPLTGFGYGTIWFPTDDSVWIQKSLTDFTWTVYHAHNGLLQIASELGLPIAALMLFMIVQQLIEIIHCQYQRQQPGVLFVLGFTVALLVSNYSEARLLVNRELYWIFFIALPVSMLQQITLIASQHSSPATQTLRGMMQGSTFKAGSRATRQSGPEHHRYGRKQLAQRRSLKQRLRSRHKLTVITDASSVETENLDGDRNANLVNLDGTELFVGPLQSDQSESPLSLLPDLSNPGQVNDTNSWDSQISLRRKLARRQRKAG